MGVLLLAAIVLGLAWILAFAVYHVTAGAIHVLLGVAVAALILHFIHPVSTRLPRT